MLPVDALNCIDIIRSQTLVLTTSACKAIEQRLDRQSKSRHQLLLAVGSDGTGSEVTTDYNIARDLHVSTKDSPFNYASVILPQ